MTHQEILAKAKRDYYPGVVFIPTGNQIYNISTFEVRRNTFTQFKNGDVDAGAGYGFLYYEGKWAEIISSPNKQLKFKIFI